MQRFVYLVLSSLVLSSCFLSDLGSEKKTNHPGKRISVLAHEANLVSDKKLENVKVVLPPEQVNKNWPSSDPNQIEIIPRNAALGADIKVISQYSNIGLIKNSFGNITPVIANGKLFVSCDGKLAAYDINDKYKKIWELSLTKTILHSFGGGMYIANDTIYITYGLEEVVAVNVNNGNILWRTQLANVSRSTPVLHQDKLFVITADNKLYCLKAGNGELIWGQEGVSEIIGDFGNASVSIKDNIVFVPHSNGQLFLLNIADGNELTEIDLTLNITNSTIKDIDTTPITDDKNMYVLGNDGVLSSYDLFTGQLSWAQEITGIRFIWYVGDFIFIVNPNTGEMASIYKKDGSIKWTNRLALDKESVIHNPVMAGGHIIMASSNGKVYIISPYDGRLIKEFKISHDIIEMPIVADKKLYLFGSKGKLSVLQ
jgi:outer membrane protein assembly factor BamB